MDSKYQKCPICDQIRLFEHCNPIKYWTCDACLNVFVIGEDKTLSVLYNTCAIKFTLDKSQNID